MIGLVSRPAAAPLPEAVEHIEQPAAAFRWFDTLGYPEISKARFGRISSGQWWPTEAGPPQILYRYGFLLEDDSASFRAFIVNTLDTQRFEKSPPMTDAHERIAFDEQDFTTYVDDKIRRCAEGKPAYADEDWPDWGDEKLSERGKLLTIAWAASRRGLVPRAERIFDLIARMPVEKTASKPATVRERVAADVAACELWRAVELFSDTKVTRAELLERFQRPAAHFSDTPHGTQIVETAAMLAQMVHEDDERARKRTKVRLEDASTKEQIAEWIYRLRDQNGKQDSTPGGCDVFATEDGNENTPAHQLIRFGIDAVPQLVVAIDDRRLTRSVELDSFEQFSHRVLTVGRTAELILEEIAGRRFDIFRPDDRQQTEAERAADAKRLILAWYDDLRRLGEKGALAAGVERGDDYAQHQAERLAEKFPREAARSIVAGARRTEKPWIRGELVELLADVDGPEVLPFLLEELQAGPVRMYVAAARVLNHRNRPEGVAAMTGLWHEAVLAAANSKSGRYDFSRYSGDIDVARFLVMSNRAPAVRTVTADLHHFPAEIRFYVVESCYPRARGHIRLPVPGTPKPDPDYETARDELLIRALEDDGRERHGNTIVCDNEVIENPRVCDMAGHVLFERDPKRFPFDVHADLVSRDKARFALIGAWRKEHGLPPLPEKKPKRPTKVAAD